MKYSVMDVKKVQIQVSGLQMVKPPELSFKCEVELDKKMEKGVTKDPLLQQEFQNEVKKVYDQTVKTIEHKCKVFDKLFVGMVNKGATDKDMQKQLKGLNDAIKQDMKVAEAAAVQAANKAWENLKQKKKEWRNFKIKVGCSIGATIAGLVVSIVAMATSPWSGGAGAAFAIIGFIKSGATLMQDISKIAMNIDQSKKVLVANLKVVETTAKNKGLMAANELTGAVMKEFFGASQPTIKTCQDASDTLKAKYAQMVVKMHDASKQLNKALNGQEKLRKEFLKEAATKLKKHPTTKKGDQIKLIEKQLDEALAGSYTVVSNAIEKIGTMYEEAKKWAATIKTLIDRVDALSKMDSKFMKVFREVLKVAGVATSILDGNSVATKAKDLGMGLGSAAASYTYDKIVSKAVDGTVFDAA